MVALLAFFGFFNVYALRANLSIAIVAMTQNNSLVDEHGHTVYVRNRIPGRFQKIKYKQSVSDASL